MAEFQVVANVTETLVSVLNDGLTGLPGAPTALPHDLRTDPGTAQNRLTVFLYELQEDPSARNRPRRRVPVASSNRVETQKSDMAILLRYLLTPWGADPRSDQIILGRVLQIFYDKPVLSGADLTVTNSVLANTDVALKITMAPLTLEDRTRIWQAVNLPYRLSITYEVRVVNIEPTLSESTAVVSNGRMTFNPEGAVPL